MHTRPLFRRFSVLAVLALLIVAPQAHAALVISTPNHLGVLSYISFNEGKGTVATDSSGRKNHASLAGGTAWVSGRVGMAVDFDGSDDYVNLGSAGALNPLSALTISAWFRIDGGSGTYRDVVSRWDSAGGVNERTYIIGINNSNALYFAISSDGTDGGASIATDPATATTGVWVHAAGTWDGTTMRLYKDGVEVATALQNTMKNSPNTQTGIGATIGRSGDPQVSLFNGAVDEVRLYGRAFSAAEVLLLSGRVSQHGVTRQSYNNGLVFYAPLDEEGRYAKNYGSVGARTGLLTNFALTGSTSNWVSGKRSGGLNFDGTNDIVVFPNASGLYLRSNLSIFAWIKTSSAYQSVVSWGSSGTGGVANGQYGIGTFGSLCGGAGRLSLYIGGTWRCSASAIHDGTWHHVGYTLDSSGNLQYYIDGATSGSVIATGTQFSAGANNFLVFGADDNTANYNFPFNGSLDEVRIYNRVLSSTEVAQLYTDTGLRKARIGVSQNTVAPESLISWHTFDGPTLTTTTSTDSSGQGNNGTLTNSPVPTVGKVGQALRFDGSNDRIVTMQNPSGLGYGAGDFSWFAWIYPERINDSYEMIWAQGSGGIPYFAVRDDVLHVYLGSTYETTSGYIAANTWQHVGVVRSSGTLTLYKNGVAYSSTSSQPGSIVAPDYAYVSSYGSGGAHPFKGIIDDLRIYNKALSATEILALYNQGK